MDLEFWMCPRPHVRHAHVSKTYWEHVQRQKKQSALFKREIGNRSFAKSESALAFDICASAESVVFVCRLFDAVSWNLSRNFADIAWDRCVSWDFDIPIEHFLIHQIVFIAGWVKVFSVCLFHRLFVICICALYLTALPYVKLCFFKFIPSGWHTFLKKICFAMLVYA